MHDGREWWGWVLFLMSAVLFLIVGAAFLVACLLFLRAYPKK
jgi:hypothetical protein